MAVPLVFLLRYIDAAFSVGRNITTAGDTKPSSCFRQIIHSGGFEGVSSKILLDEGEILSVVSGMAYLLQRELEEKKKCRQWGQCTCPSIRDDMVHGQ